VRKQGELWRKRGDNRVPITRTSVEGVEGWTGGQQRVGGGKLVWEDTVKAKSTSSVNRSGKGRYQGGKGKGGKSSRAESPELGSKPGGSQTVVGSKRFP